MPDDMRAPDRFSMAEDQTERCLRAAISALDGAFGSGYAKENPDVVAAMVQSMSINAAVEAGREAHGEAMALATEISRDMQATLLKLKPRLFG